LIFYYAFPTRSNQRCLLNNFGGKKASFIKFTLDLIKTAMVAALVIYPALSKCLPAYVQRSMPAISGFKNISCTFDLSHIAPAATIAVDTDVVWHGEINLSNLMPGPNEGLVLKL
jgi:hypothetical protein